MISALVAHNARQASTIARAEASAAAQLDSILDLLAPDLPPQRYCPNGAYAPGNVPYLTIGSGASGTPEEAIERWADRLVAFAADGRGDVLWWRVKPTIRGEVDCETGKPMWAVFAQAAIGGE